MKAFWCYFIGTWMFFALISFTHLQSSDLVVGVICGEYCDVSKETISVQIECVSINYYRTDTANIVRVYEIVRQLDNNASVDIIILLHNTSIVLKNLAALHTYNKSLVVWGDVPSQSQQSKIQFATEMKPCNCKDTSLSHSPKDPSCDYNMAESLKLGVVKRTLYSGPAIVISLMEYLKWQYVIVLYEDATVLEMSTTLDMMSTQKILCSVFHINDVDKLWADLTRKKSLFYFTLNEEASIYFLVLCRHECAKRALKEANNYDINYNSNRTVLRSLSRWIFAIYGETHEFLKTCGPDMDHVLVVHVPELRLDKQSLFLPMLKTILHRSRDNICSSKNTIKQELLKISSQLNVRCENYQISTLVWTTRGREFIGVGYIKPDGQVFIISDLFPSAKYGYNRRQFHVSVIAYPPFVIKRTVNGTAHFSGFCIDILLELARVLNFTQHISEVPDGNYGMVVDRKTMKFNGLIGQVQRNEVDMIVGDIAITKDREEVMDFTFPFYYGFSTVLLKRPNSDGYKWRKLADPLKWQVIVLVLATLPLASLIIYALERNNPFYAATLKSKSSKHNCRKHMCGFQSFYGSIVYLYGVLLCEGNLCDHEPRSFTGRTFFSCWCLFSVVIVGTYSGNLIAFLTVTKEVKPFDSLTELARLEGSYKWGTIGGTLWEQAFMTSDIPSFKGIGDGIRRFNKTDSGVLSKSNAYHINRVKNEDNYAFIADDGSIGIAIAKDCRLTKIKERFLTLTEAFGFPDKSPHVRIFAEKLMHMHDSGLIRVWKRKWWRSDKTCEGTVKTRAKPIEILDVQSAFYIAAAGLTLSAIAFGVEFCISQIRPRIEMNSRNYCERE